MFDLAALLALMIVASVTTFKVYGRSSYVVVALGWTIVFLSFGRFALGLSWAQMGMTNWISGLVWGGACILVVAVGMAAGVAIPRLHPLFADERVQSATGADVAHKSLVELPLGTVLLEEVVFRGVLMGLLTASYGRVWGLVGSSIVFGFWHILPALEMHSAHPMASRLGSGWRAQLTTVIGTILATSAAGLLFGLLLWGSGSILAPMGQHWATNSTGSIAAWVVGRRLARRASDYDETDRAEPGSDDDIGTAA